MTVEEDRNGNLWAWWMPTGWTGDPRGAFVTGSHLDSVPDGGAFDGPLGVVSAFAAIDIAPRARRRCPRSRSRSSPSPTRRAPGSGSPASARSCPPAR